MYLEPWEGDVVWRQGRRGVIESIDVDGVYTVLWNDGARETREWLGDCIVHPH